MITKTVPAAPRSTFVGANWTVNQTGSPSSKSRATRTLLLLKTGSAGPERRNSLGGRLARAALGLLCLVALIVSLDRDVTAQRIDHHAIRLESGIARIITDTRIGVVVEDRRRKFFRVQGWPLTVWPLPPEKYQPTEPDRRSEMLADGIVARGTRNVRAAWLTSPTKRYGHRVLGDAIEAGGLSVENPVGAIASYQLPENSVFEDRIARIVDIDGDGSDEILVVKSYLDRGAAIAVFGIAGDQIVPIAESAPIGLAHRWLNPIGAADFDGDGTIEIAVVRTPHIGGILMFYHLSANRLVEVARYRGFSNHQMGSRNLQLSAISDFDGDGLPDIALPTADRRVLRLLSFAGGQMREIRRIENTQGEITTNIVKHDLTRDGRADLIYGLTSGYLTVVFNRPR